MSVPQIHTHELHILTLTFLGKGYRTCNCDLFALFGCNCYCSYRSTNDTYYNYLCTGFDDLTANQLQIFHKR